MTEPSEDQGIVIAMTGWVLECQRPFRTVESMKAKELDVFAAITAWAGRSAPKEPTPLTGLSDEDSGTWNGKIQLFTAAGSGEPSPEEAHRLLDAAPGCEPGVLRALDGAQLGCEGCALLLYRAIKGETT